MQKSFILFVVLIIVITVAALLERHINNDYNENDMALSSTQLKSN
jgi:hypothetical protein